MREIADKNFFISDVFYKLKGIALFFVVFAHTAYESFLDDGFLLNICARISTVGVFVFLFASGYYFKRDTNALIYLKKKLKTTIIPWVVLGSLIYFARFVIGGINLGVKEYVNHILGEGSNLYFLNILIITGLILNIVSINNKRLAVFIFLNIISVIITAANIIPTIETNADASRWIYTYYNPYLNVFNWIGMYCLGIYARKNNLIEKYIEYIQNKKIVIVIILISIIILIAEALVFEKCTYWTYSSWFTECVFAVLLFIAACLIKDKHNFLSQLGKNTMPIYIIHIIFIWRANELCGKNVPGAIAATMLTTIILFFVLRFGLYIAKKLRIDKLYSVITGIRM